MGAYICIGLAIVLISICVFVAIGSMKTHSGGKFEKMAADIGQGVADQIKEDLSLKDLKNLKIGKNEWVKKCGIYKGILMGDYVGVKSYYNSNNDINENIEGNTPLGIAALNGHKDLVELLLNLGANPNGLDDELHSTPLHWIMCFELEANDERRKHKDFDQSHIMREIVTILINKRGDVNAITSDGETPLDYFNSQVVNRNFNPLVDEEMVDEDVDDLLKLLRKHGAKTNEELKAEGK